MEKEIINYDDLNIFMVCEKLNGNAISKLNNDFYIRNCRKNEFKIWAAFPFDNDEDAKKYYDFMLEYFENTYKTKEELFYQKCLFVCNKDDLPIATCFIWKAYDKINTIHWFKTLKEYEGKGIGRALLSIIMQDLKDEDYPIYLHTQLGSYKAIKLYSDFGFEILTDAKYGNRTNDIEICLPLLKEYMPKKDFENLKFTKASNYFKKIVNSSNTNQF